MKPQMKNTIVNLMKALLIVVGFAGIAKADDTIWSGADGAGNVSSGGYWFGYADSYHGGLSTNNFPSGSATVDSAGISAVQNGGMFNVTFTINPAPGLDWPYVGIGFDWSSASGTPVPQTWTTVCLEYSYTGTVPMKFQIKDDYSFTKDNDYSVALAPQASITKVCHALSDFSQNPGAGKQTIADCMANSIGMQFIGVMAKPATAQVSNLKLKSITTTTSASAVRVQSAREDNVGLNVSGRILSLRGLGLSQVGIYNTAGILISQGTLGEQQSMSVASLPPGIYLVRIKYQAITHARSIALY
jgi:hypothetical protein